MIQNKFDLAGAMSNPLPMSRAEMQARNWDELDILLVSGDAYVDHPSFGVALLGRWLEAHGFRVGIVAQPSWENQAHAIEELQSMGRPKLFAGVTAGAIDSMLSHYTAFRKKRSEDAYTPGGRAGARPNRACIMYTSFVRQAFSGLPVVLGGIEASLRRSAHYDFWIDALRRPLLFDSKADLLVYGMGEKALLSIAQKAKALQLVNPEFTRTDLTLACKDIAGLAFAIGKNNIDAELAEAGTTEISSYQEIAQIPAKLMEATLALEEQVHCGQGRILQRVDDRAVIINPPMQNLCTAEMDKLYALPFSRNPHPHYVESIPAWEMIRTSITTHRGCGGGCSFCSLALHQSRHIASRSKESILAEARGIAGGPKAPNWAGSISDVGGPSANMWQGQCTRGEKPCQRKSCLHPKICPFFKVDQSAGVALLRAITKVEGVRHVRVASGVRFDLALQDNSALVAYTAEFTGGQLKVAPEHSTDKVLNLMRKPSLEVFERFLGEFAKHSQDASKEQYTVPYLMSAFPGCTLQDMKELAAWLAQKKWQPQQVQCFIPTPGTVATAMFYGQISPDGQPLYVARTDKERMEQHHTLISPPSGERKSFGRGGKSDSAGGRKPYGAKTQSWDRNKDKAKSAKSPDDRPREDRPRSERLKEDRPRNDKPRHGRDKDDRARNDGSRGERSRTERDPDRGSKSTERISRDTDKHKAKRTR